MSKTTKIILILVAVPIILIVGVLLGLKLYFTQDRLKAIVIPQVEKAIQRDVSVGKVSLKIFPNVALKLASLEISNPHGMTFDKDKLLSINEITLDVSLKPLLRRELQVNEVILTKPQVYLEVNREGQDNYTFPQAAQQPATPEPAKATKPFALFLTSFQLSDGEVEYVDKKGDTRLQISGLKQTMRMSLTGGGNKALIESNATMDALSYGSTKSFLISNLPVATYERLTYEMDKDVLTLDTARIAIREIALSGKGTISNSRTLPVLDLSLQSTRAELEQLLSLVPREYLKASEGLKTSGKFQFALTVKGAASDSLQPAMKGAFAINDGSIQYAGLPKSITNVNVSGTFDQPASPLKRPSPGRLDVEKLSATLGSNPISGKLSVVNFADPTVTATFSGQLNLAEVKDYYPLEKGTDLSGILKANLSLNGRAMDPMSMKASGQFDFQNVVIKTPSSQKPLQNLNGSITFNNQVIDSKQLTLNIGQSDLSLAFTLRNYLGLVIKNAPASGKPALSATLKARQLRTMDLLSTPEAGQKTGPKPQPAAPLPNVDVDANVSIDKLIAEKFEFTNARGSVKIRNGIMTLENFSVNAFAGSVTTKGTLDMRPESKRAFHLDLNINNVEANAMLPQFTSFGSHLFGKFSMKTKLQGSLNDTLGLNPQTLAGDGSVQIAQGRLVGYPLTSSLASFTGITEFRELNFANWSNAFKIAAGRINVGDLKLASGKTDFVLSGSQGFDGSLDYKLLIRLPGEMTSKLKIGGLGAELLNYLKDKDGKYNLNLLVSGTTLKPSFALDTKQIEQAAKQALEQKAREEINKQAGEAKKKLEDELKKKQDELLDKLFGK